MIPPYDIIGRYLFLKKQTREELLRTTVKLIAIPIPPTPVKGLLYDPSCYSSSVYDNMFEKDPGTYPRAYRCIAVKDTNMGPVFYINAELGALVDLNHVSAIKRYQITPRSSAFCARIEYDHANAKPENSLRTLVEHYANNVRLVSMTLVSESCHGGSHLVIPGCPTLTALLQYRSAPGDNSFYSESRERRVAARYVRPFSNEVDAIFPVDWGSNEALEMILSECFVGRWQPFLEDHSIRCFPYKSCIGRWAMPYLRNLTHNILYPLKEGDSNGNKIVQRKRTIYTSEVNSIHATSEVGHSLATS